MLKFFSRGVVATAIVAFSSFIFAPTHAHEVKQGSITLDHIWARATVGTARPGVVYMTIINTGKTADTLTGARTAVAGEVQIHQTRRDGGVMRMVPLDRLPIPAGGRAVLEPGGIHLMLMGLKAPLDLGDTFDITLLFEKAGAVTADVYIEAMGSAAPTQAPMGGMQHNMH
jgi:copper(I)-binding protein